MIRLFEEIRQLSKDWYHLSRKPIMMLNKSQPLFLGDADYSKLLIKRRTENNGGVMGKFYVYKAAIKDDINLFTKDKFEELDAPKELKDKWMEQSEGPIIRGGNGAKEDDLEEMSEFCFSWGDNKKSKHVMDSYLRKAGYDGFLASDGGRRIVMGILNPSKIKLRKIDIEEIN